MPIFFDPTIVLLIPAIIFSLYAQMKVKSTFNKYSNVKSQSGITGAQVAERLLRNYGIHHVKIERIENKLGDHYDPKAKALRLSPDVHDSSSLAALGVAAHEAGHAIQHSVGYMPLEVRANLAPVAQIGSFAAFPLLIIGVLFASPPLLQIGIYAFVGVVLFHLVTLPVEYNASNRAVALLQSSGFISRSEAGQTKKVLNAAALTYLAAALAAVITLLRFLILSYLLGEE